MKMQRLIDFFVLMVVIDLADLLVRFFLAGLGAETGAAAFGIAGGIALWTKLGALLLTWRNLPFRATKGTTLAVGKVLILSLFWPMVVGHPSLSWVRDKSKN